MKHWLTLVLCASTFAVPMLPIFAQGSVFLSGHDSDFHALNGNTVGAQHILQKSLAFARNGQADKFLVIQSNTDNLNLGDHLNSVLGLTASGFVQGQDFDVVNANSFLTTNLTDYSTLFVPSDHGGTLTEADLDALITRSGDIINFVNAGGGIVAFAEDGFHTGATASTPDKLFKFLPFVVSSKGLSQGENSFILGTFDIGLALDDINGNYSHNIFTSLGGLQPVDYDGAGNIISAGYRGRISPGGVVSDVPEPNTTLLFCAGGMSCLLFFSFLWRGTFHTASKRLSITAHSSGPDTGMMAPFTM